MAGRHTARLFAVAFNIGRLRLVNYARSFCRGDNMINQDLLCSLKFATVNLDSGKKVGPCIVLARAAFAFGPVVSDGLLQVLDLQLNDEL